MRHFTVRECMDAVLKMVFGTDAEVQSGIVRHDEPLGAHDGHVTHVLAEHAERKIDEMNEATARLSSLQPARNLNEALQQLTRVE